MSRRKKDTINADILALRTKNPEYWEKKSENFLIALSNEVIKSVPAYKRHLRKHLGKEVLVKTLLDFKKLPIISKENYLKAYPYQSLFPGGGLLNATTISSTSGSTGTPFYFPRGEDHDQQYAYTAEILLRSQFQISTKKTLGLVCFGLGVWIGGIFTYKNLNTIAKNGAPLTLVPIGPNIDLTLQVIKDLGGMFDQILLMGYPPFIKDVLDKGEESGLQWSEYRLKILTAAEGVTEPFRKHIADVANLSNPYKDFANIYGTVELGTMGYETAFSHLIRERANQNPKIMHALFHRSGRMPSIAQYHPYINYFEEIDGMVIGSGYASSIPLLRYSFPDYGGVIQFKNMLDVFKKNGIDLYKEAKKVGIQNTILRLPFVFVYERPNNTITFRGANIYADQIRTALNLRGMTRMITGRFSMEKIESKLLRQKWRLHIELKKGQVPQQSTRVAVQQVVVGTLLKVNSEYLDQHRSSSKPMIPDIKLHLFGEKKYFSRNGKQAWVIKK